MMKNLSLSSNFKLSEFVSLDSTLTNYQLKLLSILASQLQLVRDILNYPDTLKSNKSKSISMTITSGVRTQKDQDSLKSKGYNPSTTSDHLLGLQSGSPTLGAADVKFSNINISYRKLFELLVDYSERGEFRFGQIILEFNPSTNNYWIHFGNDPTLIFSEEVSKSITRKKYLISMDNGKTYTEYKLNK